MLGNTAPRQREKIVIPVLHSLDVRKMLAGILVRDDLGAAGPDPGISIRGRNANGC